MPPIFSEKAVNIINAYTFILGAVQLHPHIRPQAALALLIRTPAKDLTITAKDKHLNVRHSQLH